MKEKFYAVIGNNACAVFDSWNRVEYARKYFAKIEIRKFEDYDEAETYALDEFWSRWNTFPLVGVSFPQVLVVNRIIFRKNIDNRKKQIKN